MVYDGTGRINYGFRRFTRIFLEVDEMMDWDMMEVVDGS